VSIQVGDKMPSVMLSSIDSSGSVTLSTDELFNGKRVVVFAVPGAFTPACSEQHLPGFVQQADAIKAKGVDTVACIAVNDRFVMDAWGKAQQVGDKIMMLSDGNGELTKALGLELDLSEKGLGMRSKRYAMIVDNGVVKSVDVEEGGAVKVSTAEKILEKL
jgi:peroxiredoxin